MKRIAAALLCTLLVLSLTACGGGNKQGNDDPLKRGEDSTQQTQGGTENSGDAASGIDFGAIMAGNGDTNTVWGQQDAAGRQAIIDAAKENGLDASFDADGNLTIKDPNGTEIVQKTDGSWNVKNDDGGEGQFGGNWPDNEYTRLVPKPDFALLASYGDDNGFSANFTDATLEQIRAYAEKVKEKGFTIDPETIDQSMQGVVVFSYAALDANGYRVQIVSSAGESGITITAP